MSSSTVEEFAEDDLSFEVSDPSMMLGRVECGSGIDDLIATSYVIFVKGAWVG